MLARSARGVLVAVRYACRLRGPRMSIVAPGRLAWCAPSVSVTLSP